MIVAVCLYAMISHFGRFVYIVGILRLSMLDNFAFFFLSLSPFNLDVNNSNFIDQYRYDENTQTFSSSDLFVTFVGAANKRAN